MRTGFLRPTVMAGKQKFLLPVFNKLNTTQTLTGCRALYHRSTPQCSKGGAAAGRSTPQSLPEVAGFQLSWGSSSVGCITGYSIMWWHKPTTPMFTDPMGPRWPLVSALVGIRCGGLKIGAGAGIIWNRIAYSHVWLLGWTHSNSWGRKSGAPWASLSNLGSSLQHGSFRVAGFFHGGSGLQRSMSREAEREPGESPTAFLDPSGKPRNVTSASLCLLEGKHQQAHSQGEGNQTLFFFFLAFNFTLE